MKRVAIIGSCGAGKSTLAKKLGEKLNLPVIHLDAYYWQSGWQETDALKWQQLQQGIVREPSWIIDGNYYSTIDIRLAAADTIIWLDYNRYTCISRILKRYLKYRGRVRPDMAAGCPERLNWDFIKYVWNFSQAHHLKIVDKLAKYQTDRKIIILQKPDRVLNLLQQENFSA